MHAMPGGSRVGTRQHCGRTPRLSGLQAPSPLRRPLWAPCPARPVYKPGSGNLQPAGRPGPLLTFINKVLLRQRHAHSSMYCLRVLSHYSSRVEKEILWPPKSEIFNLWIFKKKFANP